MSLPARKHPFARYGTVQTGTLEVMNVETNDSTIHTTGDFIVEMIERWRPKIEPLFDPVLQPCLVRTP